MSGRASRIEAMRYWKRISKHMATAMDPNADVSAVRNLDTSGSMEMRTSAGLTHESRSPKAGSQD
jgi:hypothetical protein